MENLKLNLPPFYEGQRIVALESHSQGAFRKGDEFIVLRLDLQCCGWVVDVGKKSWANLIGCHCGIKTPLPDNTWWFTASRFAPIEERFISFAEVIAIESQLIGAN